MFITFFHTKRNNPVIRQLSFEDIYNNFGTDQLPIPERQIDPYPRKLTVWNENFDYTRQPIDQMITALTDIHPRITQMLASFEANGTQSHYETFHIPKHSGGMRRIDAPKPELMTLLRDIKDIFEKTCRFLPHDRAFAYVKQRSTLDALREHQKNESKWFLKLDIKDFFPTCTFDLIITAMETVFPFAVLMKTQHMQPLLHDIAKLSLLNDCLPQGTPLSPLLTNLIMVAIDYNLYKELNNFENQHYVYTRYADDLLISCKYTFDKEKIINMVKDKIESFNLNTDKIRYGSAAGRNWNLGLMLNKDNNITIGYRKKQRLKAAIFSFLQDFTNNNKWSKIDTQVLLGQISYYKKIEPQYIINLIAKYNQKFNTDFKHCTKEILRS